MATLAPSVPEGTGPSHWFWGFLKEELTPFSGRAATVARMSLAATLIMLICVTFRIPYGFQGAVYALIITRESPRATVQSGGIILLVTAISLAYIFSSVYFVISVPLLHFLWVIGSFFLAFYALSAIANYGASVIFAIMIAVAIPLWDRQVSAETNLEDTLRLALAAFVGVVVTAAVELAFRHMRPGDDVVLPMAERLDVLHSLLVCFAEGHSVDDQIEKRVVRFATLGTSRLRPLLKRSDYSPEYIIQMSVVVVLVGRLMDLAATLTQLNVGTSAADQQRLRTLAAAVARLRIDLINRRIPDAIQFDTGESPKNVPLLGEMENTVALIPEAFAGSQSMAFLPFSAEEDVPRSKFLVPDAFVNPEDFKFALKGCLAASACYMIYNFIAWPGISTSVTTCLLTGLTTIGASRQKQILRLTGALVGGFVIGMGSQIFVLPYVDSIGGFTVVFIIVTAVSSWFITSSPRLSYFGVQVAFAYYLINLQEFAFQTSLSIARDRVVGILVGLFAMWLVFDRLWGTSAGMEMKRTFISNLRLVAQLAREPLSKDLKVAVERSFALREMINNSLDQVRALADTVLFEFGPSRRRDLLLRDHIRRWQPQLRTLFVMRTASLKYRLQLPDFELPETVRLAQQAYDASSALALEAMADQLEGKPRAATPASAHSFEVLEQSVQASLAEPRIRSFVTLVRRIDSLTASLAEDIAIP